MNFKRIFFIYYGESKKAKKIQKKCCINGESLVL